MYCESIIKSITNCDALAEFWGFADVELILAFHKELFSL